MKIVLYHLQLIIITCLLLSCEKNEDKFYPKYVDQKTDTLGYSLAALRGSEAWANINTETAAVVVMVNGKLLYQWGNTEVKYNTHSVRKSFMSALYGKYINNGTIDLDATMADLGIDDIPSLTEQEKLQL